MNSEEMALLQQRRTAAQQSLEALLPVLRMEIALGPGESASDQDGAYADPTVVIATALEDSAALVAAVSRLQLALRYAIGDIWSILSALEAHRLTVDTATIRCREALSDIALFGFTDLLRECAFPFQDRLLERIGAAEHSTQG